MNEEFVIVWRAAEGAAVQTYANPDKTPRIFSDMGANEAVGAAWVERPQLEELLETRDTFEPKLVGKQSARELLGWPV